VLRAFAEVEREFPRALLILAPRKPDRFDEAARIIVESRRELLRRSSLKLNGTGSTELSAPGSVLLLDSMGELASLYRFADAVFVGARLSQRRTQYPGAGRVSKVPVYALPWKISVKWRRSFSMRTRPCKWIPGGSGSRVDCFAQGRYTRECGWEPPRGSGGIEIAARPRAS